jgi:hypothetical protein
MTDSTYSSPLGHKGALLLDKATRRACGRNFLHNGAENDAVQGRLLFERADEATGSGVYYPATLKSMRTAFELAWKHISPMFEDAEAAREILAVQILHHVDRGEHNVGRLATSATDDLIALTGPRDRRQSARRNSSPNAYVKRSFADYRALRQAT